MTLLFYCQHSLGMGHFVRSTALAARLAEAFDVVFLNGGALPEGLPFPWPVTRVDLPPLGMREDHGLISLGPLDVETALAERRDTMIRILEARRPSVLLIELFPFGRKKFEAELRPLLDAAHAMGEARPLVVCSLRDLLVTERREQQRFDDRAQALCDRYFDLVLVHTDPAFARLEDSFRPSAPLRTPLVYTGFTSREASAPAPLAQRDGVVVSAGGGQVGGPLFHAAVEAHDHLWRARRLPMTIVCGPFAPPDVVAAIEAAARAREGLTVLRQLPALAPLLASARASVSQCGYNTALDLLQARVPALVVPYAAAQENEQSRRALRLATRGLVRTLRASWLTGATLAAEIESLLSFEPASTGLRLDGAESTVTLLLEHLQSRAAHARPVTEPEVRAGVGARP